MAAPWGQGPVVGAAATSTGRRGRESSFVGKRATREPMRVRGVVTAPATWCSRPVPWTQRGRGPAGRRREPWAAVSGTCGAERLGQLSARGRVPGVGPRGAGPQRADPTSRVGMKGNPDPQVPVGRFLHV